MPTSSSRGALPQLPAPPTQLMLDAKGRSEESAVSGSGGLLTSSPKREADLAENSTSLAESSQKKKADLAENSTSLAENSQKKKADLAENSTSLAENSQKKKADLAENSTSLAENSQKKKSKLMSFGKSLLIPASPISSRRPSSEHFSEIEIVPASAALQKFIEKHGLYPMMPTDGRGWPASCGR
jgi:myosin heavy subunit